MNRPEIEMWMTVNETAERLGLSRWTIRNLARLGRLPAKRKRRGWLIPRELVNVMAKELEDGVPNEAFLEWEREHATPRLKQTQPK